MGPSFLEGGPIMYRCCPSVCLSVRLSVPCLHLEGKRKRKGLRIPNLVGRIPGTSSTPWTNFKVKGSKVKVTAANCVVGEKSTTTKARSPRSVVKSKWFSRWQHLLSPCGSTHVLNCKDGPIPSSPSTAAHSCLIYDAAADVQYKSPNKPIVS